MTTSARSGLARAPLGTDRPTPAWRQPALLGLGTATATAALALVDPSTTHVPLCPLKALTGIDCPLCGSLRAVHALAHLHPGEAASHNLLLTIAAPFLVAGWAWWMARALRRPQDPDVRPHLPRSAGLVIAGLAAAFFVARNTAALAWLGSSA